MKNTGQTHWVKLYSHQTTMGWKAPDHQQRHSTHKNVFNMQFHGYHLATIITIEIPKKKQRMYNMFMP